MNKRYVPINKGNYSMDTLERDSAFESKRGHGWMEDYIKYRKNWTDYAIEQKISDYPLLVDVELSSLCNLKCPMCYTITDEFKNQVNVTRMNWDLFVKIVDEIGGKVPALRLSLRGEATLHKKFIECIAYAKKAGIKEVSLLTHGGRLTLPFFKKMVDAGVDWITISVDGIGDTYERVRKPLKFNDVLNKIKDIHKYKKENKLERPVIKIQGIWPAIVESGIDNYYKTFEPFVDLIAFNPLIDYLSNDVHIEYLEDFTCPQQYQRLVIGADGLVMKCSNDEENREIIGNLNEETVHQVWHGKKMNEVRSMHLKPRGFLESPVCRKCYLPRKTKDEVGQVQGRTFKVKNYLFRIQVIGK